MKKLKDLFNKLVDKVFGKRCQCDTKIRVTVPVRECEDCGELFK